ncbi:MAG TPA: glycosyltransferase family 39 protein [Candidatus Nanoarchaeia archaeon]|nr:glycosyltransferase family 39 protein [Candidatus Nanoarchaeia archaeon]
MPPNTMDNTRRLSPLPFAVCAILIALVLLPFLLVKLPEHDELPLLVMSDSINAVGVPLMYYGEDAGWGYGYVHPPLYTYAISLVRAITPMVYSSFVAARIVGVLSLIVTILLAYLIIRRLSPHHAGIFPIFLILYLLNAVVLRKSLLILFDTSLLSVLLLAFVYLFIRFRRIQGAGHYALLLLVFTLALWTKFTTPYLMLAGIVIYTLIRREYARLFSYAAVGVGSTLLFVGTWYLYTQLISGPFLTPFQTTLFGRIVGDSLSFSLVLRHIANFAYHLFWFSPAFILLLLFALGERAKDYWRTRSASVLDFFALYIVVTWGAYLIRAPNINYLFPIVPIAVILLSFSVHRHLHISAKAAWRGVACMLALFAYYLLLPDPLLLLQDILPWDAGSLPMLLALAAYVAPVAAVAFPLAARNQRLFVALCIILLVPMSLSLAVTQAFASYSTEILYGREGYVETLAYAQKHVSPNDLVVTEDEIAYFNGNRFYPVNPLTQFNICGDPISTIGAVHSTCGLGLVRDTYNITEVILVHDITYIIYSDFPREVKGGLSPEAIAVLAGYYRLEQRFGDFYVYQKT